ncbi:hypothetical protein FRC03_004202 [Tulasnella sp. 419]|nr:hypothetical protein FRC03_004202 [Tulasnella sp. 419]
MTSQLFDIATRKLKALQEAFDAFQLEIGYDVTPQSESTADGDLRTHLEAEIAALVGMDAEVQKQLSSRRKVLNRLSPIHQLPKEILSEILYSSWRDQPLGHHQHQFLNFRNIEQVCSYWRQMVRTEPLLYSGAPLDWNKRMVAESGDSPLHIVYHHSIEAFLELIDSHLHRWGSFRGNLAGFEPWNKYFLREAPLLKSFSLTAPRLSELSIPQLSVPWESNLLRGLKLLHMQVPEGTAAPCTKKFRQILEACPDMQEIRLIHVSSQDSSILGSFDQDQQCIIHLPYLRSLSLGGLALSFLRWLLETIRAPPFEDISIRLTAPDAAAITKILTNLPSDGVLARAAGVASKCPLRMRLCHCWIRLNDVTQSPQNIPSGILLNVSVNNSSFIENPILCASTIFPSFIRIIRTLEILDDPIHSFQTNYGTTSMDFLRELSELTTLILSHTSGRRSSILEALGSPTVESADSISAWPCPKLTTLRLRGSQWYDLTDLLSCIKARYGINGGMSPEMPLADDHLPMRLENLIISEGSYIGPPDETVLNEIKGILGDSVVSMPGQFWISGSPYEEPVALPHGVPYAPPHTIVQPPAWQFPLGQLPLLYPMITQQLAVD